MSNKNKQTFRRYEDVLERKANKARKIQQREEQDKQFTSRRLYDSINTDEDDYSDIDEMMDDDLHY